MYPLTAINRRLVQIIGACYSDNGLIDGKSAVYSPYSSKSEELCSNSNNVRICDLLESQSFLCMYIFYIPKKSVLTSFYFFSQQNMATMYSCGAEFLPSPLASKAEFALTSKPSFTRKGHMTAVAVAREMDHAVAFVGTSSGEVTNPNRQNQWCVESVGGKIVQ